MVLAAKGYPGAVTKGTRIGALPKGELPPRKKATFFPERAEPARRIRRETTRGLDLRLKPFVVGGGRRIQTTALNKVDDAIHDIGLDARYGLTADHITIAPGAAGANFQSFLALVKAGDDVLIESPGYDPLIAAVKALGARVTLFERTWQHGFALDPAAIRSALTPATTLIVISNAHNPSGALADANTLREIGAMARAVSVFRVAG